MSAPGLQECTNSHTDSLTHFLGVGPYAAKPIRAHSHNPDLHDTILQDESRVEPSGPEPEAGFSSIEPRLFQWPSSAEEFAVFAMRLQWDLALRQSFRLRHLSDSGVSKDDRRRHIRTSLTSTAEVFGEQPIAHDGISQTKTISKPSSSKVNRLQLKRPKPSVELDAEVEGRPGQGLPSWTPQGEQLLAYLLSLCPVPLQR